MARPNFQHGISQAFKSSRTIERYLHTVDRTGFSVVCFKLSIFPIDDLLETDPKVVGNESWTSLRPRVGGQHRGSFQLLRNGSGYGGGGVNI